MPIVRGEKKRRNGKAVSEYNSDAMDTIISNEADEERTCLLGGGAGRSSDRSGYRVIERAKGVILPLDHRVRQMDRKRTKPLR